MIVKPYLIQSAKIEAIDKKSSEKRLSQTVNMCYMGSAEFEFGALPKSLLTFENATCASIVCNEIKNDKGASLRIYHHLSTNDFDEYLKYMHQLREDSIHLKESIYFAKKYETAEYKGDENLWWDIKNHVFFSFHKVYMNTILPKAIQNSVIYMNSQKD